MNIKMCHKCWDMEWFSMSLDPWKPECTGIREIKIILNKSPIVYFKHDVSFKSFVIGAHSFENPVPKHTECVLSKRKFT